MSAVSAQVEFDSRLNSAVAELGDARRLGPMHAQAVLIAARHLIDQALDECKRTRKGEAYEYPRQEL